MVALPREVPAIRERLATGLPAAGGDHYKDPELRAELFERDGWRCQYCGDLLTVETATLDHIVPLRAAGANDPDNLATACLMCNSIKSGRSYEEAAPELLAALKRRRSGSTDGSEIDEAA